MGGSGNDPSPGNDPKIKIRRCTSTATGRPRRLDPRDLWWDVSPSSAFSHLKSRSISSHLSVNRFSPLQDSSGLFHNYADNTSTFLDASSTALLASTVYRLSLLCDIHTYLPQAEFARKSLSSPANNSGLLHFTKNGWLTPVVDPYSYPDQGKDSPEGEAFVISMQAAWRDWVADGAQGLNVDASSRTTNINASAYILLASCVVFNVVLWRGI